MKYGPIICDPKSDEAMDLIGKKVIGCNSYYALDKFDGNFTNSGFPNKPGFIIRSGVLTNTFIDKYCPFILDEKTATSCTFIREVIEEPPQYRPYKDTEEMIEDFKKRFKDKIITSPVEMPLIWLTPSGGGKHLVTDFSCSGELIKCMDGYESLDVVFDLYTYLDGSPVGKEEA